MSTPKMKAQASFTPEQIRAIVAQHEGIKRHRRFIRFRAVCRVLFWMLVGAAALWIAGKTGALDDYENTCEALGKICGKP